MAIVIFVVSIGVTNVIQVERAYGWPLQFARLDFDGMDYNDQIMSEGELLLRVDASDLDIEWQKLGVNVAFWLLILSGTLFETEIYYRAHRPKLTVRMLLFFVATAATVTTQMAQFRPGYQQELIWRLAHLTLAIPMSMTCLAVLDCFAEFDRFWYSK